MTVGQLLKHDFSKGSLSLHDTNGNVIYFETSTGYWSKREFDSNGNQIYCEDSDGHWYKREYDANGKIIYSENSKVKIEDKRPKGTCSGKIVEIEGKKYKLTEV